MAEGCAGGGENVSRSDGATGRDGGPPGPGEEILWIMGAAASNVGADGRTGPGSDPVTGAGETPIVAGVSGK